ncbi:leucine-rich repeat domain-containing protein [Reichenbachiella versicolor]|uniref:leucine-rich repeat domain-containing protein n=1 Tax=Reichenbachiella versicolor TaxID=1821036 RepID=UPI000D6DE7A3|nr:leucine-rich repeat domain-containing protein [Reichenbachiella versicolor]
MSEANSNTLIEALKKIEDALQVKLEEENHNSKKQQPNSYKSFGHRHTARKLDYLTLSDLHFESFDALAPVFNMVKKLTLINCRVDDVSAFLSFKCLTHIVLDGVTLPDTCDLQCCPANTLRGHFKVIHFKNMEVVHIGSLLPFAKYLSHLEFDTCQIRNFYEVNLIPALYSLTLTNTHIHNDVNDEVHKADLSRNLYSLRFKNMELDDFIFFLPITRSTKNINIENSILESFHGIEQIPQLEKLAVDTGTTVKVTEPPEVDSNISYQLKVCEISKTRKRKKGLHTKTFDFQKLASIAHCIKELSFHEGSKLTNTTFLKHFTRLDSLVFNYQKVDLSHFLPIAQQIRSLSLEGCQFMTEELPAFTQLERVEVHEGHSFSQGKYFRNLKKLLPLKQQLKKLALWVDEPKGMSSISEFGALESLVVQNAISEKKAQLILSLPHLKKLRLNIKSKKGSTLDLKAVKGLEYLQICGRVNPIRLTGIDQLIRLKHLALEGSVLMSDLSCFKKLAYFKCEDSIDINQLSSDTLKVLELDLDEDDYRIQGLEQFPNLEELLIDGVFDRNQHKFVLGKLDSLRVLKLQAGYHHEIDFLDQLPNLERLDLSNNQLRTLKGLASLQNLKMLDVSLNELKDLDGLEHLQNLVYLDLIDNGVSEVKVLNNLPALKQVNLPSASKELVKQLDNPGLATYLGGPYRAFTIWEDQSFYL